MTITKTLPQEFKSRLLKELNELPQKKIEEVLDFIFFLRSREVIDPSQAYFWTRQWQKMEMKAEHDKRKKRIIGNGTVTNLLKELDRCR